LRNSTPANECSKEVKEDYDLLRRAGSYCFPLECLIMEPAPAWLSYASSAVALLALGVAVATYRRAGPNIKAKMTLAPLSTGQIVGDDYLINLRVNNTGLAPIDLLGFYVALNFLVNLKAVKFDNSDISSGEPLPFRIDSSSEKQWTLSVMRSLIRTKSRGRPYGLKLGFSRHAVLNAYAFWRPLSLLGITIALGNGMTAHAGLSLWQAIKLYWILVRADGKDTTGESA
jgi:hypothetical protein